MRCSAFGSSALSIDMNSCVTCDYSPVVIIVLLVVLGLLGIFSLRKLLVLVKNYPGSVAGSLASITILTSHAQMMNVVSRMDLEWPYEVEQSKSVLEAFYMNLPSMVRLQCLSGGYFVLFLGLHIFFVCLAACYAKDNKILYLL